MRRLLSKICGLTQAENARQVAELRPDFLGFIFVANSIRCVSAKPPIILEPEASQGVRKVGVFRDQGIQEILRIAADWQLDGAQLHGSEDPAYCAELRQRWPKAVLFKAGNSAHLATFNQALGVSGVKTATIDYFLADSKQGGSGQVFPWEELCTQGWKRPVFLAGGLGPECIERALNFAAHNDFVAGFDFNSKLEPALAGLKDLSLTREVLGKVSAGSSGGRDKLNVPSAL